MAFLSSFVIEPFLDSAWSQKVDAAYPPNSSRGQHLKPSNLFFAYAPNPSLSAAEVADIDAFMHQAIKKSAEQLTLAMEADGQRNARGAPVYPNYAIFDTPLQNLYGSGVRRLKALKKKVDPTNVMGLAGGFKL